ncbi:MAG: diguanylate cyclase [Rhodoferax sp.]
MDLHVPTLFLVVITVSATLAGAIAAAAYRRQHDELQAWALALLLHAIAYVLFSLRGKIGDVASIVVANSLLAASLALFTEGILQFQQRHPPRWLIWLPVAAVAVTLPFYLHDLRVRIIFCATVYAAQSLMILVLLLQKRQETVGRGQYFLVLGLSLFFAVFVFRGIGTATGLVDMPLFTASNLIQSVTYLNTLVCLPLMTLGLVVMARERTEDALHESNVFVQAIVDSIPSQIVVIDKTGVITAVNATWRRFAVDNAPNPGTPAVNTGTGANYLEQCRPATPTPQPVTGPLSPYEGIKAVLDGRLPTFSLEYDCHSPTEQRWYMMTVTPFGDRRKGAVIVHNDITARKKSENAQRETLNFLQKVSAGVPGVIYEFRLRPDGSSHFPYISPRVEIFGLTPELLAKDSSPIFANAPPEDAQLVMHSIAQSAATLSHWRAQFRMRQPAGGYRWYEGQATPEKQPDGSILWFGYFSDIQLQKEAEERIRQMALQDVLTGLPNRALFDDRVQAALTAAQRDRTHLGLMFIDLDQFKPVNDCFGHRVGDMLLKEVANRLRAAVRESDTPARIGGDEFVVLLRNILHADDALKVAEKIRVALCAPFTVEGHALSISASIGIALYPEHGVEAVELARHADEAMYRSKEGGSNQVSLYAPST